MSAPPLAPRIALRVRGIAESLDLAVPLCLVNRRPLGWLTLGLLGPILVVALALRLALAWDWPLVWSVLLGLALLAEGAFTVAFGELLFAPPEAVEARRVLQRYVRALPRVMVARFVASVVTFVTLAVPPCGAFLLARLHYVPEAVLLERAGPFAALARSSRFVRRRTWAELGLALACWAAPAAGAFGLELLGQTVLEYVLQLDAPFGAWFEDGGSPFALAGALLAVPWVAAARFLGYVELRTRKEGWDLQLRFLAIAARHAGQAPARREAV